MLQHRDLDTFTRMIARSEEAAGTPDEAFLRTMIALTARQVSTLEEALVTCMDADVIGWIREELADTMEDADELANLLTELNDDPNETDDANPYMPD